MGTPLGPKYIPYTYMDPLGLCQNLGLFTKPRRLTGLAALGFKKGLIVVMVILLMEEILHHLGLLNYCNS